MRLIEEILRRPLKPTQLRVVMTIWALTHGRGVDEVQIHSIAELARACWSARPHVSDVVDELVSKMVLARDERRGTWWLQPLELWHVQPDRGISAAVDEITGANDQVNSQGDMFHVPTASEFLTTVRISDGPSVRISDDPLRARGQATRQPDQARSLGKGTGLDHAEWKLLDALISWSSETGEACTPKQRADWGWRIWTRGSEPMAAALRLAVQHVRAGKPTRSRFGLLKSIWQRLAGDDKLPPAPRSAERLHGAPSAPPAGGVHAASEPDGEAGAERPPCGLKAAVLARLAQSTGPSDTAAAAHTGDVSAPASFERGAPAQTEAREGRSPGGRQPTGRGGLDTER